MVCCGHHPGRDVCTAAWQGSWERVLGDHAAGATAECRLASAWTAGLPCWDRCCRASVGVGSRPPPLACGGESSCFDMHTRAPISRHTAAIIAENSSPGPSKLPQPRQAQMPTRGSTLRTVSRNMPPASRCYHGRPSLGPDERCGTTQDKAARPALSCSSRSSRNHTRRVPRSGDAAGSCMHARWEEERRADGRDLDRGRRTQLGADAIRREGQGRRDLSSEGPFRPRCCYGTNDDIRFRARFLARGHRGSCSG